jgi:hypothetical protein
MSSEGAAIDVPNASYLPERFELMIATDRTIRRCAKSNEDDPCGWGQKPLSPREDHESEERADEYARGDHVGHFLAFSLIHQSKQSNSTKRL